MLVGFGGLVGQKGQFALLAGLVGVGNPQRRGAASADEPVSADQKHRPAHGIVRFSYRQWSVFPTIHPLSSSLLHPA